MKLLKDFKLMAPARETRDWAGDPTPLESLRGRVVLLDFFSYGDPEGIRALRWLRPLADHYREAGLTVVGVHVPAYGFERPPERARREVWRLGIPWPVALDHDLRLFQAYENRNLPGRYLVDSRGTVRGWQHGPAGPEALERAVRTLLREARPERKLPPPLDPLPGFPRPGRPTWLPSGEIRFGSRSSGFGERGESGEVAQERKPAAGDERDFGPPPEFRAEGRAYLEGRWRLTEEGIVSGSDPAGLSIVFEGSAVAGVLSRPESSKGSGAVEPRLSLRLDGEALPEPWMGADVECEGNETFVRVDRGSVFDLVDGIPFGIHHLEARVSGAETTLHLLAFGTQEVPEED